jgi:hypothetical protein
MAKHKIWLNESDSLYIEIPDEMTIQEWYDRVEKFKDFQKTIDRSYIKGLLKFKTDVEAETESETETDYVSDETIDTIEGLFSRKIMIELLKAYWTYPTEASERRIEEVININALPIRSREDVKKMVFKAINRYKISSEEVGLKRFPAPGDDNLRDLIKK